MDGLFRGLLTKHSTQEAAYYLFSRDPNRLIRTTSTETQVSTHSHTALQLLCIIWQAFVYQTCTTRDALMYALMYVESIRVKFPTMRPDNRTQMYSRPDYADINLFTECHS